ncbi:MAG: SEC-C metal-binding domain-containing protein [Steroidobacteraceae bacterium]
MTISLGGTEPDVDELIAAMIRDEDRVPRELIEGCARRGPAMIDALDRIVGPVSDWNSCASDGHWWLRLHAAFILGLMDGAASGHLLAHLMRRLAAGADENIEDWLAGYWPALFRNKPEEILSDIEAIAWGDIAQPFFRVHVLEVLLAAAQRRGSEELDALLARIARWVAAVPDPEERASAANILLDFPRSSHRDLLGELAARQKSMFALFDESDVERAYTKGDQPGWVRFDDPWRFYSPEQIDARQKRWAEENDRRSRNESAESAGADDSFLGQEPYLRETLKVGRNDPCPCGSGKKYKKCCLRGV